MDTGQEIGKKDIFLVDYALGAGLSSGLEFIKISNFEKRSVLGTSQYDRKELQNEAIKLGLMILPTNRISAISIKNFSESNDWDLVLIDDDDLIHVAWNFEAIRSKRKLKKFFYLKQFRRFTVNKSVPIFVDYQLESTDGVNVANELQALGFENIYLATGQPIDSAGSLPDGSEFVGVAGLEQALLARPELFVGTLTEKLMTFGLGRGIEHYDAPAIRKIVHDAREDDYRFSRLILGIVNSMPFQMRNAQ